MNYSVKRFIKKWSDRTYTQQEFETLANDMAIDSDNRYTQNSALKVLARYATVDGTKIKIDPEDRNYDRNISKILDTIKKNSKDVVDEPSLDSEVNYDESEEDSDNDNDNKNINDNKNDTNLDESVDSKSDEEKTTTKPTAKSEVKPSVKTVAKPSVKTVAKPSVKNVVKDKPTVKPTVNSTIKPTAKATDKSIVKPVVKLAVKSTVKKTKVIKASELPVMPKNVKLSDKVVLKVNEPQRKTKSSSSSSKSSSSSSTKIEKKAEIKPVISKADIKEVDTPARKMNLFAMKKFVGQNSGQNSSQNTNRSFNKTDKKNNTITVSDENSTEDTRRYEYPKEGKYKGLYRTDELYGPYGTDNYHDTELEDDKLGVKEKNRLKIFNYLDSIEYPAQRSKEWFALRDQMITASDGGTIVGLNPYENPFDFIVKKVHGKPFETSIDCYHGKKYEEVATMVYEYRMNVKVKEFGLCQHPKHKILGASPDGIVCPHKLNKSDGNKITKYVGRMLEIKCPMRRKILMDPHAPEVYGAHGEEIKDLKKDSKIGICPSYYWVQVQLQLECCNLDECDFWQCEIWEYMDADDFAEDTDPDYPWISKSSKREKGALIQIMPIDKMMDTTMDNNAKIYNFAEFIYQPRVDMSPHEIDEWILKTLHDLSWTHKGMMFQSIKYYKVIQTRNITIQRDKKWFEDNLPKFQHSWRCVEYFRKNKDKSDLLKKYLLTFKKDYYGKIKENYKGEIMDTINKICSEPSESASDKEHREYARYIQTITDKIEMYGIELDDEFEHIESDVKEIQDVLNYESDEDLDENERVKNKKRYSEFLKKVKKEYDTYLFGDSK